MKFTRRKYLAVAAAGLVSASGCANKPKADGIGPNRGVTGRRGRGKQTCTNTDVPTSNIATRLSAPEDFGTDSCVMTKDSYEGPYFTCTPAAGKDISGGKEGQPLIVAMRLVDEMCQPIPNGVVDIWSCDALGHYSGYSTDPDKIPPIFRVILFGHLEPDTEERFCRGALRTDADGIAEFNTIYPGYYYGVPIHVHFKAHVDGKNLLTSQANFSEDWNEHIQKTAPYNAPRPIKRKIGSGRFPVLKVIERDQTLLAVLNLVVPS